MAKGKPGKPLQQQGPSPNGRGCDVSHTGTADNLEDQCQLGQGGTVHMMEEEPVRWMVDGEDI